MTSMLFIYFNSSVLVG